MGNCNNSFIRILWFFFYFLLFNMDSSTAAVVGGFNLKIATTLIRLLHRRGHCCISKMVWKGSRVKDSMLHSYSHSEGVSKWHFWSWEHFGRNRKQEFLGSSKLKGWRKKLEMSKCTVISLSKKINKAYFKISQFL